VEPDETRLKVSQQVPSLRRWVTARPLLLVTGMMHLGAIALVATAITVERLAPRPERAARAGGPVIIVTGVVLIARAMGVA
jgi:predicted metal-binding membrane protein